MPLPPLGGIPRSNSMPNLQVNLERPSEPADIGQPQNQVPVAQPGPQVVQPDPALENVVNNGVGPDLQPGNGQGRQFVANHEIASGRDWDLHTAEGMLDTARKSMEHIRSVISGKADFRAYDEALGAAVAAAVNARPGTPAAEGLTAAYADFKQVFAELRDARAALMDAVKDGSDCKDPNAALAQIRKTLRVFRYELQQQLAKTGHEAGQMGFNEGNLRAIQHAFTFGVGSKVAETFARVVALEARFDGAVAEVRNRLRELDRTTLPPVFPPGLKLANVAADALELSHRTNERIRDYQDAAATESTLRGIVGPLVEKGGSRKVEFTVAVGALVGLGFSSAFTAGLRAGARVRVVGEVDAPGKGRPISVTFRLAGGLEAKAGIKAGEEAAVLGGKAEASGGIEISHFTTRTYPTLEDMILDAKRCKLATSRTLGGAIWGGIKALGRSIGGLGTTFFRWLGRKSGEVKLDNAQYLESLKARGVAGRLDRVLARRANPVVAAERTGWTARISGKAKAGMEAVKGVVKLSVSGSAGYERDFGVSSKSFVQVARAAREAKDAAALNALMRAGPDGGVPPPVRHFQGVDAQAVFDSLEHAFDEAVEAAEAAAKSSNLFHTDTEGFARAANRIRSLLLSTEMAARDGALPREAADRLLARYANPAVKFPPAIYREYFLEGSGAAKPAKIRVSASAAFETELFSDATKSLTGGIGSSIGKAVADGAVKELRHQAMLDNKVEYRFTSEKPAKPGADPRPWENAVKTSHSLVMTASMPARYVIDAITRSVANKGERIENRSDSPLKDSVKASSKELAADAAKGALFATLPGLILASVKETAVAAVKKWLSDPENVQKLVKFALDHLGDALDLVVGVVEFVANHPDFTLQAIAMARGTEFVSQSERLKVVKWSFIDGELDTISVHSEISNKLGVDVDPVGVGLGVGFDISYSVTETVKDRDWLPHPTLTGLLAKSEEFLFGETGLQPSGGGQAFKLWLSRNATGVERLLGRLDERKNLDIYERALAQAQDDFELQVRLQDAWRAVQDLPADATPDAKVDAAHALLVALTLAFRAERQPAVAA